MNGALKGVMWRREREVIDLNWGQLVTSGSFQEYNDFWSALSEEFV